MKILLTLFTFVFLFSSCDKKLSDGKYVKATIISTAGANEIGMIEFHSQEHNDSYIALFDGAAFPTNNLDQIVYATIITKGKVAFAENLTVSNPGPDKMYTADIKTSINYHSSTNHKVVGGGFHTKMHYQGGLVSNAATEDYTVTLYKSDGSAVGGGPLTISSPLASLLESYGQGVVYADITSSNITQIDTCHKHGQRIISCR